MKGIYLFLISLLLGIPSVSAQSILRGKTVDFGSIGIYSVDENDDAKLAMSVYAGGGITIKAVAYGKDYSTKRMLFFEIDGERLEITEAVTRDGIKLTSKGMEAGGELYPYEKVGMPANFWDEILRMGRESMGRVEMKYQICAMDEEGLYIPEGIKPDEVSYRRCNYVK